MRRLTLKVTGAGAPAEGTQQAQLVGRPVDREVRRYSWRSDGHSYSRLIKLLTHDMQNSMV